MNASSKIEAKHTPGPWKVFRTTDGRKILGIGEASDGGGVTDAKFGLWRDGEEAEANAHLIAAAPELLSLVKQFAETVEYYIRMDRKKGADEGARCKAMTLHLINAAIAKAEGRS